MSQDDAFREPFLPLFEGQEFVVTDPKGRRLPSYIRDHRKRLRDRFLEGGAAAMPDYELLELLLFRALPRCDVKPVARRLIETFGDFARVLSAPQDRLIAVKGVGPAVVLELKIDRRPAAPTYQTARESDAEEAKCVTRSPENRSTSARRFRPM